MSRIRIVRHGWLLALSIRSRSCSYARCEAASSAMIFGSPLPDRTCAPAVDVRTFRGKTTRNSTNCFAGTFTACNVATPGARLTTPRTQAGLPQTRYRGPTGAAFGSRMCESSEPRDACHSSPQTRKLTSTTSSYAIASPRIRYEIWKVRCSSVAE
jgi:hypothetical protein